MALLDYLSSLLIIRGTSLSLTLFISYVNLTVLTTRLSVFGGLRVPKFKVHPYNEIFRSISKLVYRCENHRLLCWGYVSSHISW